MPQEPGSAADRSYADLLSSLLALRSDPATEHFDALLGRLESAGHLDPAIARELRWWQRESVRGVEDYVASTLPVLLYSVDRARVDAADAKAMADRSWRLASPDSGLLPEQGERSEPVAASQDAAYVDVDWPGNEFPPPQRARPLAPPSPYTGVRSDERPQPDDQESDLQPEPAAAAAVPPEAPAQPEVPPVVDLRRTAPPPAQSAARPLLSPRRRLLVTGLTVLRDRPAP